MSTLSVNTITAETGNTVSLASGKTLNASQGFVPPAGHVIQYVSNQTTAAFTSAGGDSSFSNVLGQSITPTSTSSKIKITVCGVYYVNNTVTYINHRFRVVRDGAGLSGYNGAQDSGTAQYLQYRTSAVNNHIPVPFNFTWINSPNTTSSTTYTLQFMATAGTLSFYEGAYIHLEEISG
jgi:hypothetical protein